MNGANASLPSGPIVFIDDAHTFGGAQIALSWAIRALLRNTEESIVCVCTSKTRQVVAEIAGESARLEFIQCPRALPLNILSFPLRLPYFFGIVLRLRRRGARAWWLNLSGIEFCLAPLLALKILGEAPRAWLHNSERFSFFNRNALGARRALSSIRDTVADKWLFGLYAAIVTPSRSTATSLQARTAGAGRTCVGHLYPTIGGTPAFPSHLREEHCSPADESIDLWMIGRVELGHKNNLAALDALRILSDQGNTASLTMVGDGPDIEAFKSRAAELALTDKIAFLGWRENPWKTIQRNSIVLIPSLYEGMPLVAIESMLRGVKMVSSPLQIFFEGIPNQLIAHDFSAAAFAEKIVEVHAMSESRMLALYAPAITKFSEAAFASNFIAYTDAP
ncbi:MAG: glycosyltransferase [Acidobacteriaceae bacterium]